MSYNLLLNVLRATWEVCHCEEYPDAVHVALHKHVPSKRISIISNGHYLRNDRVKRTT